MDGRGHPQACAKSSDLIKRVRDHDTSRFVGSHLGYKVRCVPTVPLTSGGSIGKPKPSFFDRPRRSTSRTSFQATSGLRAEASNAGVSLYPRYTELCLADNFGNGQVAAFPLYLRDPEPESEQHGNFTTQPRNCSPTQRSELYYLAEVGAILRVCFPRIAVLHAPAYRDRERRCAPPGLAPCPAAGLSAVHLQASAELGRELAALLDPGAACGVTAGTIRPELRVLGCSAASVAGRSAGGGDFALTGRVGPRGKGGATMPGRGRMVERRRRTRSGGGGGRARWRWG